jgi:GntR family transcriptional regulator
MAGRIYQVLRQYGLEPDKAINEISLTFAKDRDAELLDIRTGDPLIRLREVVYDQKGRPLHNSNQMICGNRYTARI